MIHTFITLAGTALPRRGMGAPLDLDWSGLFVALLGAGVIGVFGGYIASQLALARQDEKLQKLVEKIQTLQEATDRLVSLREVSGERSEANSDLAVLRHI